MLVRPLREAGIVKQVDADLKIVCRGYVLNVSWWMNLQSLQNDIMILSGSAEKEVRHATPCHLNVQRGRILFERGFAIGRADFADSHPTFDQPFRVQFPKKQSACYCKHLARFSVGQLLPSSPRSPQIRIIPHRSSFISDSTPDPSPRY
jgi:hypothetical protein